VAISDGRKPRRQPAGPTAWRIPVPWTNGQDEKPRITLENAVLGRKSYRELTPGQSPFLGAGKMLA
jgi:hypothetical protein